MSTNIHTEDLLTPGEEILLGARIEAGLLAADALARSDFSLAPAEELLHVEAEGRAAWQRFLLANVRLVRMVASREAARVGLPVDELFQEGFLGLLHALQRWDFRRGMRFSTFGLFWVRQGVQVAAAGQCGRLPVCGRTAQRVWQLRAMESQLEQELGRTVATEDVAQAAGRSPEWVSKMMQVAAPLPLADLDRGIEPEEEPHPHLDDVLAALAGLPEPERVVLKWRLGFVTGHPVKQVEVAARLGWSESTVRRLERRGLERLRAVVSGALAAA